MIACFCMSTSHYSWNCVNKTLQLCYLFSNKYIYCTINNRCMYTENNVLEYIYIYKKIRTVLFCNL